MRRLLAADPAAASREGGPYGWPPLLYLAYARHDLDVPEAAVLAVAQALLDRGADPNAGYLWHGLPSPFTVLTGVFGGGELGPDRQPHHPHAQALARRLLEAGADPNDAQALYNRMFESDDDHLALLLELGLGRVERRGPWPARLGNALPSPHDLVQDQLRWAITHDLRARVALLAEHGADLAEPDADGRTPADLAALNGNTAIEAALMAAGAASVQLWGADALVAAAMRGDGETADELVAQDPGVVTAAREARPGLLVWAASQHRADAVELLLRLGWDVNARGRADAPVEMPWETALHAAAGDGDLELARLLLTRGADPSLLDARFESTPLGWAGYFGRTELIALLEPVTPGGTHPEVRDSDG